ncbi:hypothetical protein BD626DRAFT_567651 [Schizophyllum amplum]|uniref:G-protein coupled receptors family 1 profile domain-containing protein n=1 Tax=Schizophyllum amplum TaxID=97359 RepID=A0A550CJ50_9AGAR|nr:hypothetical protein BD626DRAFT_567651 [Auriculariopsis ampla]
MSQNGTDAPVVPPEMAMMKSVDFTDGERASARVVNGFAILSTLAIVSVAVRIAWLAARRHLRKDTALPKEYAFFRTQLGNYAVCLLIANMFNNISGLMGISYTVQGGIVDDMYCQAQAVIMQLGNCATAYFTVALAFHSFASLGMRMRQSSAIGAITISVGWVGSVLLVTLPTLTPRRDGPIYGIMGLSCAVRSVYPTQQFEFHILPIFIASILSAILYSLIFLVLRGTLKLRDGISLNFNPSTKYDMSEGKGYNQFVVSIARSLLWYPIVYILLLLPYSVTLLLAISGFNVPFPVLMVAFILYFMISVANVLLLYNTFRVLGPAFDAPSLTSPSTRGKSSDTMSSVTSVFSAKKDIEAGKEGDTSSWYSQPSGQFSRTGRPSYARQLSIVSSMESEKQRGSPELGNWRVPEPAPTARKAWERAPPTSAFPGAPTGAFPGAVPRGGPPMMDANRTSSHSHTSSASSESSLRVLVLPSQRLAAPNPAHVPSVSSQDVRGWLARQSAGVGMPRQVAERAPYGERMARPKSPTNSVSSGSSSNSRRLVKPNRGLF